MHRLKLLADSRIGMVHKCDCCAHYHVTLGKVSLRQNQSGFIALTKLVARALKIDCFDTIREAKKKSIVN